MKVSEDLISNEKYGFPEMDSEMAVFVYQLIVVRRGVWVGVFVRRGDKTSRRVRVRVLALLENPQTRSSTRFCYSQEPRRDRVRVLALLENPRRDEIELSMVQGSRHSSMDILVLAPWIENGTRTRMSTDGWLVPRSMDRVPR